MQDRLLWPHGLYVIPLQPNGTQDEAILCRGKDISPTGIGFYLPHELMTADVLIELPNTLHPPMILIPATLVRANRCADGWYDVGAIFRVPALRALAGGDLHLGANTPRLVGQDSDPSG